MAPVNPSFVLQSRSDHPAQLFRLTSAGFAPGAMAQGATSPGGGVNPAWGNRLNVTGTSGMTVNVDTGLVYMPGTQAWQGLYTGYNTASYSVPIPAASATQWRSDYIVARQHDTSYGDADDNWDIIDVEGSFSSSSPGGLPTPPNNSVILAIIRVVPNMAATNGVGTVVDARVYSNLPGPIFTSSGAKPPLTAPEGTMWWEQDTNLMGVISNSQYRYFPVITQAADTWHSFSGLTFANGWTLQAGSDLPISGYRLNPADPTMMQLMGNFSTPANNSNANDGTTVVTLPTGYRVSTNYQRIPLMFTLGAGASGGGSYQAPFFRFATDGTVACYGLQGLAGASQLPGTVQFNGQIRLS